MKKILALFLAGAAVLSMSTAVYAQAAVKTETVTSATITFDTDKAFDYIHTFGNAEDTNLTLELTDDNARSGKALKLSENFKTPVTNQYGGFYLDASDFGLENFAGHTIELNIRASSAASKATNKFDFFADGSQWTSISFQTDSPNSWRVIEMAVPVNSRNTKVGLSFPITESFNGDLCLVDDITISDNYGNTIANIGDIDTSLYQGPSGVTSVLTTILFIVLILAVIGGSVLFFRKVIKTFR